MTGSLTVKSGIYYAVLSYSDENGKRKQKWISSGLAERGNKRRAEEFLKQTLSEFAPPSAASKPVLNDAISPTASQEILFVDFMYRWLEHTRNSIELNTYESYKSVITRYVKPYFESSETTLSALQPIQIQEMYNHYMVKGLSATTVLKIHANVRKALGHAVRMNMIPYNPAERVELPKKQKFVGSFYTEEQVNLLLAQSVDEPIYPAILLGAFYGLRRSDG